MKTDDTGAIDATELKIQNEKNTNATNDTELLLYIK